MFGEIIYWLINMSITATITGCAILLLEKFKKIPRKVICFLWIIPFIRMWLPFGFASKYNLMWFISKFTTKVVYVKHHNYLSATNFAMLADEYFPITYKSDDLYYFFNIASIIWLTVFTVLLIIAFTLYFCSKQNIKNAIFLYDNVYVSYNVTTPAVYGIIKPKIILPTCCKDKDIIFILAHEKSHIKTKDNLWRIIGLVTVILHWFNPFSWLFLKHFLADLEFACDERVLKTLDKNQKKDYAKSLLDVTESKYSFISAFGGASIHKRINNILSYKKLSLFSAIYISVFTVILGYILLTNAV